MENKDNKLSLQEINEMDPDFRNAHKSLLRLEAKMGEKDLYFILKKHYKGRKGYVPKFDI